jgi:hypothetical protein
MSRNVARKTDSFYWNDRRKHFFLVLAAYYGFAWLYERTNHTFAITEPDLKPRDLQNRSYATFFIYSVPKQLDFIVKDPILRYANPKLLPSFTGVQVEWFWLKVLLLKILLEWFNCIQSCCLAALTRNEKFGTELIRLTSPLLDDQKKRQFGKKPNMACSI